MEHDLRLSLGIENVLDEIKELVGSVFGFFAPTNGTIMASLLPTPPAMAYNKSDNMYYLRYRGIFAGTLDPNLVGIEDPELRGVLQNRDEDFWAPITAGEGIYKVRNKTELDALTLDPPAIVFRRDTHRYYYRMGPEGYGGRTGRNQRLDGSGNPMWDSGPAITGNIVIPGLNTWNTLYTDLTNPLIVAGTLFGIEDAIDPDTLLPIIFQIVQITGIGGGRYQWSYIPEYDSNEVIGNKITAQTIPPVEGYVRGPPDPPITSICYVANLTGIILIGHTFTVEGFETQVYTILDIDENQWVYEPESIQFPNAAKITMTHEGNPIMEQRDPDIWALNSHLYEDNTQGVI